MICRISSSLKHERVEVFGIPAIYIQQRIDKTAISEGFYAYDIRGDGYGAPACIEQEVTVNFEGTLVMCAELTIPSCNYIKLGNIGEDNYGLDFLSVEMSLQEWIVAALGN